MQGLGTQPPMSKGQGQQGKGQKPYKMPLAAFLVGSHPTAPSPAQSSPTAGVEKGHQVEAVLLYHRSLPPQRSISMTSFVAARFPVVLVSKLNVHESCFNVCKLLVPVLLTRCIYINQNNFSMMKLSCQCSNT